MGNVGIVDELDLASRIGWKEGLSRDIGGNTKSIQFNEEKTIQFCMKRKTTVR